jgi:hypothetical protein
MQWQERAKARKVEQAEAYFYEDSERKAEAELRKLFIILDESSPRPNFILVDEIDAFRGTKLRRHAH